MKRPILKDYPNEMGQVLSEHQLALIEWSWWADDRIKEQKKQAKRSSLTEKEIEKMASKYMCSGKTIGGGDAGWIQGAYEQGVKDALALNSKS